MNREIKFRFWDGADNCWSPPSLVEFSYQDVDNESVGVPFHLYGKEIIIQQYTGLKDKNGKEIYEGDLIEIGYGEHTGAIGKVIFEYGSFMLESEHKAIFQDTYKSILYGQVIGNIFES